MEQYTDSEIRHHAESGDLQAAVTCAVALYGPELLGFLAATMPCRNDAEEVFSQLCEDIWRGIAAFQWRCSFRTWAYTLARHAASRFLRSPQNKAERHASLSAAQSVALAARSQTSPHLRTDVKDRFARLREGLDMDDQTLLILRVDRNMSWKEVGRVMAESTDIDEAELARNAARLRKRFQIVKEELRRRASAAGLLG